jgi:putative SOS response-associated peptidase YedK
MMQFGLTPHWANEQKYWFNARAEGDNNKENDPNYVGPLQIISKPAFRKAIRSQRCLVPADAFIEGTTEKRLSDPFCVFVKDHYPVALAGIWDEWTDKGTGELVRSFAVITTSPNELLQQLPHHRMPVILNERDEDRWLDPELPLADVLGLLRQYPADAMNAYPISPKVKTHNGEGILDPVGGLLVPDEDIEISHRLQLQGMGNTSSRQRRNTLEQGSLF